VVSRRSDGLVEVVAGVRFDDGRLVRGPAAETLSRLVER
jgi:hypothetical protein